MIELARISRVFQVGDQAVHALREVTLTIASGEYVSLMGPSGSGKSTLLNILGLLDRASSGTYRLADRDVTGLSDEERARVRRERIGFVFQFFHLIPSLTAYENVAVPMEIAGAADAHERTTSLLAEVGLQGRSHHYPSQLSGGEQQRVALARALANDPPIVLADEPTGNLDTQTGEEILSLIRGLHERLRSTVVIVTHDMKVAESCPRTIKLRDGRIVEDIRR